MPNNSRIHLSGWEFFEHCYRNAILLEKANGISKVHRFQLPNQHDAPCHRMQTWTTALPTAKHGKLQRISQCSSASSCTSTPTWGKVASISLSVASSAALSAWCSFQNIEYIKSSQNSFHAQINNS